MRQYRRRKQASVSKANIKDIDYKNIPLLQEYIMESGRIVPAVSLVLVLVVNVLATNQISTFLSIITLLRSS